LSASWPNVTIAGVARGRSAYYSASNCRDVRFLPVIAAELDPVSKRSG
jgi:hypothetical protein